jgi:hypothetical protein
MGKGEQGDPKTEAPASTEKSKQAQETEAGEHSGKEQANVSILLGPLPMMSPHAKGTDLKK